MLSYQEYTNRRNHLEALMVKTLEKYADRADNIFFGRWEQWDLYIDDLGGRKLGVCHVNGHKIGIDTQYLNEGDIEDIEDTILHECAHALAGFDETINGRRMAHGKHWRMWARRVGANPRASKTAKEDVDADVVTRAKNYGAKWLIVSVNGDKVEPLSYAKRKLKNLGNRFMPEDKAATLGNLWLVCPQAYSRYQSDISKLKTQLVR